MFLHIAVNHSSALHLKIVFLPLLAFEVIILIDNFRYNVCSNTLSLNLLFSSVYVTTISYNRLLFSEFKYIGMERYHSTEKFVGLIVISLFHTSNFEL